MVLTVTSFFYLLPFCYHFVQKWYFQAWKMPLDPIEGRMGVMQTVLAIKPSGLKHSDEGLLDLTNS